MVSQSRRIAHTGLLAVLLLAGPWGESPAAGAPGAAATDELAELLSRVGKHARRLEQMEKRASFLLRGHMEELDGEGKVDGTKRIVVRVTAKPDERVTEILQYLEDGTDKTEEAREKQRKEKRDEDPKKKFVLPFSPGVREAYVFSIEERDSSRVRIAFTPRERAENRYAGSAWIDTTSGEILTMGFSPTKNPLFVDHVDIRVRFENSTPLGRAPSEISFEARGSLLVFKKHYRGAATLTDARISF